MGVKQIKNAEIANLDLTLLVYCNHCGNLNDVGEHKIVSQFMNEIAKSVPNKKIKTNKKFNCFECGHEITVKGIKHVLSEPF